MQVSTADIDKHGLTYDKKTFCQHGYKKIAIYDRNKNVTNATAEKKIKGIID